jgi:tetratricopeptide (TPR) repeat protein
VEPAAAPVSGARVDEHRNLGLAFYKTAMYDEAVREFRRVVDLQSSDQQAHFFIGLVALRQGRAAEAVEALRHAADRVARPAVLHDLAVALEQLGRIPEAEAAYEEAAARAPTDARIVLGWGICALRAGRAGDAVQRLDRARELLGGKAPTALWYWARALAAVVGGETAQAERFLEEGIERYPRSAALRNNLAAVLEQSGDLTRAEQVAQLALEEDPSLPQTSKNLGDLFYRAGRTDEAQEAYARAIQLAPRLGEDVYFKLGNIAFKAMRYQDAREFWSEVLSLNPEHSLARSNLDTLDRLTP